MPWFVEFRHASWAETSIVDDLAQSGIGCATTDRLDLGGPLVYLRLLGRENSVARFDAPILPQPEEVARWAERIAGARAERRSERILAYVRNFFEGHAPATLLALRQRLGLPVPTPPGRQQMRLF